MLKRLVDFVVAEGSRPRAKLTLQDITLCQLWHDGQTRQNNNDDSVRAVRCRIEAWIAQPDAPDLNTAGRRHQGLLRMLLSRLVDGDYSGLGADEVTFLYTACNIIERSGQQQTQSRFCERIKAHRQSLLKLQARLVPSNDVHQLEQHIHYATEADIQAAETSAIRLLAGLELPCRGPVFTARTHLRILGDVPDNCTVVVDNEGSCSVDGYVMGRIMAKNHCEVRQNISGVAIVLRGHIRARSIINNALVVAKMGSVVCNNAQGPKLIFAGRAIHVHESTMLGKFITREMVVEDKVRGGHLEIAGNARANAFHHLGMSNLVVVLRRELSCEDFGEVTGDDLKQLLSRAYSLRRKAHNFKNMAEAAQRETDHTAQSVLMYIFGGGEVQKRLKGFLHAQRQHTLVSNVVDNLQGILEQAQDGMTGSARGDDDGPLRIDMSDDAESDSELVAARAAAEKLQKSLRARNLNRNETGLILDQVRQKLFEMREVQQKMAERVVEEERSVQHLEKYEQVLAGSGEGSTKREVLEKILPAMRQQPAESPMGKRLRSGFIIRALRTLERAVRHASEFGVKADQHLQDFRSASERLGREYQIRVLENPESEEEGAQITGIFDSGTRIFMDMYIENIAEAPPNMLFSTPEDTGVRTYIRANDAAGFHSTDRR